MIAGPIADPAKSWKKNIITCTMVTIPISPGVSNRERIILIRVEFYSKNQLKEMQEDYKAYKQKLEESDTKIHDVGVQVYRNVQAVIEKSQDKSKEDIKDLQNRLETLQVSVETKNSALLPLTIITMVLVIADLVFNILRFLGII